MSNNSNLTVKLVVVGAVVSGVLLFVQHHGGGTNGEFGFLAVRGPDAGGIAAPNPFPGLSANPRLLSYLGSVENATLSCPPTDQAFTIAKHPLFNYEIVTYGPSEMVSQICLLAVNSGGHGHLSLFFEEPAVNFVVDLLHRATAEAANSSSPAPAKPWMLDVGANIGVFSVPAAAAGFPVLAIEATPGTAARLRCSAARNNASHFNIINAAVVDPTGPSHVCVEVRGGAENLGANTMTTNCAAGQERVPTMLLDQLPMGLTAPTVFKLDIEGYELHALRGGVSWIKSHLPTYVYMELIPFLAERSTGSKVAWLDALTFWFDLGYHAWVPGPGGVEITPAMVAAERAGTTEDFLAKELAKCSNNLLLSRRTIAELGVAVPPDVCLAYGTRSH